MKTKTAIVLLCMLFSAAGILVGFALDSDLEKRSCPVKDYSDCPRTTIVGEDCDECPKCVWGVEDDGKDTRELVSDHCPLDCEDKCAPTKNDDGRITSWQCVSSFS